ncbi:polysaccharide biosynthesis/export family protein [Mucilaginibacter myungsuensis]|uniref:Polysaccharide biosynthesis/export family protein n=1 Tax=Mucilaginibacter myungsuensis TaxID=649104 RepID=A0A929PVY9_9SPHI|nr:polysaccharide biosynthesis/export family protein [Mucilaginibacter myungsuensis]MBE9660815.1 polysaccharide biosynthesis/export family protein [Mucilaginibacter myungsuensis]MDN3600861.1 polysaccharide biosynthesis/export family protein [Mucilaginibacter myungsuensis]
MFEQKNYSRADSSIKQAQQYKYLIKPDDILQVRNLQDRKFLSNESTATGGGTQTGGQTFQVDEEGLVTLPVVGRVNVAGLTRQQAEKKMQKLYTDSLFKNAIIELKITNLQVRVFGEVGAQGNYPLLKEKTSLIDVLGQAGGLNKTADEKTVRIIRGAGHEEIMFDLSNKNTLSDPRLTLQNDDIIVIAQNKRAVRDDKVQSFSTVAQPSLLLLNTALIILSLFR